MILSKYFPDSSETERANTITTLVTKRFEQMKTQRKPYEKRRQDYLIQYNAEFDEYKNVYRSSSSLPLASSLIETHISYALKMKPEYTFKCDENKDLARLYKYIWDKDYETRKRYSVILQDEYDCATFGTSVLYTGISEKTIMQYDLQKGASGASEFDYIEKPITSLQLQIDNVDLREMYIDDRSTNGIDGAEDCVRYLSVPFEKFEEGTKNNFYSNIEKVKQRAKDTSDYAYRTNEDNTQSDSFVNILCYWNKSKDMYVEIANGVLVRATPIFSSIDGIKELPFVWRIFGKKMGGIYGRGYCEGCLMFQSELNKMTETILDQTARGGATTMMIGSNISFNGEDYSFGNIIKNFDGDLNDSNFRLIPGEGPNAAVVNMRNALMNEIPARVGNDINNMNDGNITAFQTQVQQERSQKRTNVIMANRDIAYNRLADLHMENLIRYYDLEQDKKKKIVYTEDEIWDKAQKKFMKGVDNVGKHALEVESDDIEGPVQVSVQTNITAPTIASVDRQQQKELLNELGTTVQSYALAKQAGFDIETVIPLNEAIKNLASMYNIKVNEKEDTEEADKAVDELRNKLMQMGGMQNIMNPQPQQAEQQATQQPQQAVPQI